MRLIRLIRLIRHIGLIGLIGLMGLSLASCSSEEHVAEPKEEGTPITFNGSEAEPQEVAGARRAYESYGTNEATRAGTTRAATPLSESATAFKVWGYKNMTYDAGVYDSDDSKLQTVFPGYSVNWINNSAATTTSNTNGWEYVGISDQTIKYWDWSAKAYRFFGVTDYNEANGANGTYGPYKAYEYSIAADASPVRDGEGTADDKIAANMDAAPFFSKLWFSTGNAEVYPDKQFGRPVTLEFLKPFARVRFMFIYSYEQEGIKLKNPQFKPTDYSDIALKGTVKVHYPLTGTKTEVWYTTTPKEDPTTGETLDAFTQEYIPEGTEKWYMVFPRTSQGSYTMHVNVNGEDKTAVVPAEYMTWLPGYSYTYKFKVTDLGGVEIALVEAAVTPWHEMEINRMVYNW